MRKKIDTTSGLSQAIPDTMGSECAQHFPMGILRSHDQADLYGMATSTSAMCTRTPRSAFVVKICAKKRFGSVTVNNK